MRVSARSALSLHVVAVVKMYRSAYGSPRRRRCESARNGIDIALFDVVLALTLDRY